VPNENTTKSIELKLAEVRSLVEQADESVTILYLIDMILSESRSISWNRVSAESRREGNPGGLPRPPKLRLVS
jgi:hypothetical protein